MKTRSRLIADDEQTLSPLVFYASAGVDGIYFGYDKSGGEILGDTIVTWYSMEERCERVTATLAGFLGEWISGNKTV